MELLHHYSLTLYTALLFFLLEGTAGDEYGSSHSSHPPFYYIRSGFTCNQNKKILWDSIALEVHPGATDGCGILIPRSQAPYLWSSIDGCLNGEEDFGSIEECDHDHEYGLGYTINITKLQSNRNITFPCAETTDVPEIVAIHLIYNCKDGAASSIHPEDDIMTLAPRMPPIHIPSGPDTSPPPPPTRPAPTMVVEPEVHHTPDEGHVVVTEAGTTVTSSSNGDSEEKKKDDEDSRISTSRKGQSKEESSSHPITYNELAVIVGPSVAAIAVLILILVIVIVVVKRKNLKLPVDLQGESLFHSRRFSTASQLSDISLNGGHQLRSVP